MKFLNLISSTILLLSSHLAFSMADICDDPFRDAMVCKKMRIIRSQVNMLEGQRDLMQVNYKYLYSVANDMNVLATDLMDNHNSSGILNGLVNVTETLKPILKYSKLEDSRALVAINQVHGKCTTCHAKEKPLSGYKWDVIAKTSWGSINLKCNEEQVGIRVKNDGGFDTVIEAKKRWPKKLKNPYRCKSMHGMFGNYEYLFTTYSAGYTNFDMVENVAREILRISTDLKDKKMVHQGANDLLAFVMKRSKEVIKLAQEKNPEATLKGIEVVKSCSNCHNSERELPRDYSDDSNLYSQFKYGK